MNKELPVLTETTCNCTTCVSMCKHRPCWGTPEESEAIMNAGLGSKLMIDYWTTNEGDIVMAQPAILGYEGGTAPIWPDGQCAFLENNLCTLHDKGLKPLEGRAADCKKNGLETEQYRATQMKLREYIVSQWDTEKGKNIFARFVNEFCD